VFVNKNTRGIAMIKSLLTEYGLSWTINRILYSLKLKMMTAVPAFERLFERNVFVKRIDIFELDVQYIRKFLLNLSAEEQHKIVTIADKAVQGVITGFSSIELGYGNPINWSLNPLTQRKVNSEVKWYRISDFDTERGDIKVVWEASRFTHFLYLARAYLITDNKKYYYAFVEQLRRWLMDNPYSYGANYKCGQECALRMINALMAYTVFESSGLSTVEVHNNVRKLVEVCYKKILANFFYAHKCIKNNHTLSEICGLIIGAWCCEDNTRLRRAYNLLDKEVKKQFFQDGGYIQCSFNYQRFALQIIECVFKLSKKTGMSVSEDTKERVKKSVILMYQAQDENGDVPNYGSNDGALIFPVTVCDYRDFRPVLNTVYALTEGKRLYKHGDYDEELLWFGNKEAYNLPSVDIEKKSSSFPNAGLYTLRYNMGFLMVVLKDYRTRPCHMDGLHIDLWHNGINIFCDSGTYSYASDIGHSMVLTAAHNTVQIDNKEQMRKRGPFMLYNWTSAKDIEFSDDSFLGTMVSKNGYEHTRCVKKTKSGYLITDQICGDGEYCYFYFHTPCEVKLVENGFELFDKGSLICSIMVDSGVIENKTAYRSLYYLKKEKINCISVKSNMNNRKCSVKFDIIFSDLV
jgi:hypothetical protein